MTETSVKIDDERIEVTNTMPDQVIMLEKKDLLREKAEKEAELVRIDSLLSKF